MRMWWTLTLWLAWCAAGRAEPTPTIEQRLRHLEQTNGDLVEQLEKLRAEREKPEKPEKPEVELEETDADRWPLKAYFDDGVLFTTADENFQLRLHVMNQTDFKLFVPGDQEPARSGLYNPRFRVYFEGRATRLTEYELSLQRSVEGQFDVLDANLNFHFDDAFQVRFGRFLVPYSFDWYDHLEQYFIAPERGLFPLNFGLSREAGVMAWGRAFDQRLGYAFGGFDGQLAGLADTNTTRDAVGYINARPYLLRDDLPCLQYLNLGGSFAVGQQAYAARPLPLRTAIQSTDNDEAAQAASAILLDFNDDVYAIGGRYQGTLHLAWYYQHWSVETEAQAGQFTFARDPNAERFEVPVLGMYATVGYFLTGETLTDRRKAIVPLRPFDPPSGQYGPGAIEPFARYSQLNLGKQVFDDGLADSSSWTRDAYVTDVGWNWYPNRFVKFYFDWQHSQFGTPVLQNAGKDKFGLTSDLFWVRGQIYY